MRRPKRRAVCKILQDSARLADIMQRIGTAIFDKRGRPFACLSITGAADRLHEKDLLALAPHLVAPARRISIGMSMD